MIYHVAYMAASLGMSLPLVLLIERALRCNRTLDSGICLLILSPSRWWIWVTGPKHPSQAAMQS